MSTTTQPSDSDSGLASFVARGDLSEESLWEFVRLGDYKVPSFPARSAAANAWRSFKQIFKRVDEKTQAPVKQEAELRALPEVRLEHLVPPLDWNAAAAALDASLTDWMAAQVPDRSVRFVIGQPHGGHGEILRHWRTRHDAMLISPPTCEQVLAGDARWLDEWRAGGRVCVLPNLERCYLRHAHGLSLVRRLLEEAETGRVGRGVIGCDSWAWAYLQRVWPVTRPDALTLRAFNGRDLSRLFAKQASGRQRGQLRFRNARTGNKVLSVPVEGDEVSSEIAHLAAHCRGNVGTAIRYWRERLRAEPEPDKADSGAKEEMSNKADPAEEIVWLSAILPEPLLPGETDEDAVFVLHTLLLHGGLQASLLPELLPLPEHRCMALLIRLRNAGLVQCVQDRWSVPELAYAYVRGLLRGRGYLTDDF